ncbi:hypothetical protein, partial [Bacillus thuringiensis]
DGSDALAVLAVQWHVQVDQLKLCFRYGRLGTMPIPPKFFLSRGKGWRFFEWFSQKILPVP